MCAATANGYRNGRTLVEVSPKEQSELSGQRMWGGGMTNGGAKTKGVLLECEGGCWCCCVVVRGGLRGIVGFI